MMFPSLRGGNDNPGYKEGFFGEVDDVLAAAEFLARQTVRRSEAHLPGRAQHRRHAGAAGGRVAPTGSAPSSPSARSTTWPGYRREYMPFDTANPREVELRSPGRWLHSIKCPTFVFEGNEDGNASVR